MMCQGLMLLILHNKLKTVLISNLKRMVNERVIIGRVQLIGVARVAMDVRGR